MENTIHAGFDGQKPLEDRANTSNVGLLYFELSAICDKLQVYQVTSSFDDDVITKCFNKNDDVIKSRKILTIFLQQQIFLFPYYNIVLF